MDTQQLLATFETVAYTVAGTCLFLLCKRKLAERKRKNEFFRPFPSNPESGSMLDKVMRISDPKHPEKLFTAPPTSEKKIGLTYRVEPR